MQPREPKYRTIAADLAAAIRDGVHEPGQALPSQRDLSAAYGVTLATLRQALQLLQDDGLISQQPGRGTFVSEPRAAYRLDSLRGLEEDLAAQGQQLATEILVHELVIPPPDVAAQLGLAGAAGPRARSRVATVLRLERIRLIGGRPAVHQISWVGEPGAHLLTDVDLSARSLYAALAEVGVVVEAAEEVLRPGVLAEPVAGLLRRAPGEALFCSERLSMTGDGLAVVLDQATILGSAMEIRTRRVADGVSLQWTRPETGRA
ncbi:MAG: GntR family transcriptional regulator [Kineosporiaceae bacterium]|nr:GntR family transcriptional regulator [Kineosporiaceae bacterium]MBK8077626.1 GntR family transcriptional regulator [Kineosporiaceae bacterium]